ncbi:MAG: hypothetical protein Q8O67_12810 [Deltaproteobacteria bacterium]|nr:hypothetical protein [Deltaproteobacteria bacterium]
MPELLQTLWRFSLALSRRGNGVVDVVATDRVVLGTVVVQQGRLAYVAIPGDQRHLGRMMVERHPASHATCMVALENARASGIPFAAALLALAPDAADDVRACLVEQSARRLVVLCEAMRSGCAAPRFKDASAGALELTMEFWQVHEAAVARVLPRVADDIDLFFRTWGDVCTAALLMHADATVQVPVARRGALVGLGLGLLDEIASAVGRAVRRGRVLIVGSARDWSLTVRTDVGAAWLCIEDDDQLDRVIAGTQAIRSSDVDGARR